MQLESIQLRNTCAQTKSPIWMKIAGSPSPGTPGEVTGLGFAASILVRSPGSRTHWDQEPYLDPQASPGVAGQAHTAGHTCEKSPALQ